MAGRNSKFNQYHTNRFVEAVRLGATYKLACHYAQISTTLWQEWQNKGEAALQAGNDDDPYAVFLMQVKEAEGVGALGWLAKIEKAANDGTWQAAAWKLERRYPHAYGRKVNELVGKDGGPIVIVETGMDTDEL